MFTDSIRTVLSAVGAVYFGAVTMVQAATIIDTFDGGMDDWESRAVAGGAAEASITGGQTTGGRAGTVRILADSVDQADLVFAGITDNEFAGNKDYTTLLPGGVESVTFQFYAGADDGGDPFATTDIPGDLRLYFVSAGSITWYYDIDVTAGWGGSYFGYGANFYPYSGWYTDDTRSQTLFMGDLADVDEIGLEILYQDWDGQVYGIDDFTLSDQPVPEPSTYAILGFALLSLGLVLVRQRQRMFSFDLA